MTSLKKKKLSFILAVSLLLGGCAAPPEAPEPTGLEETAIVLSSEETVCTTEATEPGIPLINMDGILYAADLGEPVLGPEKVLELYDSNDLESAFDTITHIGDALYYFREVEGTFNWEPCELLIGDYEAVGTLRFCFADHAYDLMYLLHNGVYHVFDLYNPTATWIYDPYNDCMGHTDFNLLCDRLVAAFPYESTAMVSLETPGDLTRFFSGYPAELVQPVLGQEAVEDLYKARNDEAAADAITTVGDALYYIIAADMHFTKPGKQPRPAVNMMRKLLAGDYDTVDCLGSEYNNNGGLDLLLVQHKGIYYVFDVFNPYGDWAFRTSNDCRDSNLEKLIEKTISVCPQEGTILQSVFVTGDVAQQVYGMPNENEPCFTVLDTDGLQKVNARRSSNLASSVGQVDILKKFEVYDDTLVTPALGRDNVLALHKAKDLDAAAETITNITDAFYYLNETIESDPGTLIGCEKTCNLITKLIADDYDSVGYIDFTYTDNYYRVLTVEYNGIYYAFDPFRTTTSWILRSENNCASATDLESLSEKLLATFPFKGTELLHTTIIPDALQPHGAPEFEFAGTMLPVGLGQPLLTDKEIDQLIAEDDFEKMAHTITTLPDAVNLYLRYPLKFYDQKNNNEIGKLNYVQSACQVLKSGEGQCVSTSNLTHYLLEGDYDEVGYVYVRSPGDGHIMSYILQDGLYYLINPVQYTDHHDGSGWLAGYPNVVGCSENFQNIADSLVKYMKLGDEKLVTLVHQATSPGDFVVGEGGRYYAKGMTVTPYYGIKNITYIDGGYEWDTQTRIDY